MVMKKIYLIFLPILFISYIGSNKTGIKGIVLYGPTSEPIEGVSVKAIPRLDTEEKTSLTKTGTILYINILQN